MGTPLQSGVQRSPFLQWEVGPAGTGEQCEQWGVSPSFVPYPPDMTLPNPQPTYAHKMK